MTEQTPTPDPWKAAKTRIYSLVKHGAEICPQFTYGDAIPVSCQRCGYTADVHLIRDLLAARAHDQQRIADLSVQNERLTLQARDISLMLSESGCGAMPIVEGVRWLIGYDHRLRAALSTAEATSQQQAKELADLEATIDRNDVHTVGLLAQLDTAEATIASLREPCYCCTVAGCGDGCRCSGPAITPEVPHE